MWQLGERDMAAESLIVWLIVGGIAGWLAGLIVRGFGFGLIGNIVIGIVGAFIAGWLLPRLGILIGGGIIAEIINALIGAIILRLTRAAGVRRSAHLGLKLSGVPDRSGAKSVAPDVFAMHNDCGSRPGCPGTR
jgi:uncharacterized membrane protein YeaQ/YmgE (transglycosylase-associated protein family)